jgi:hypothetical protein
MREEIYVAKKKKKKKKKKKERKKEERRQEGKEGSMKLYHGFLGRCGAISQNHIESSELCFFLRHAAMKPSSALARLFHSPSVYLQAFLFQLQQCPLHISIALPYLLPYLLHTTTAERPSQSFRSETQRGVESEGGIIPSIL